ncbi:hypothetical protein MHYP_G00232460 [Metynnis hypsauchen]
MRRDPPLQAELTDRGRSELSKGIDDKLSNSVSWKCEIRSALEAQLVDKGILPERAESLGGGLFSGWKGSLGVALSSTLNTAVAEAMAGSGLHIDPGGSLSPGLDPHLAIQLKELELEIKIQEHEAESFHLRVL